MPKIDWGGIGAILAIIGTVVSSAIIYFKKLRATNISLQIGKKQKAVVSNKLLIQAYIDNIRMAIDADRVDISFTSNGGKEWQACTPLYYTILFESISQEQITMLGKMDHQMVDAQFLEMLQAISGHEFTNFEVDVLPEGVMKDACMNNGTQSILMTFLVNRSDRKYFLSVSYNNSIEFDHTHRDAIRGFKGKLVNLLYK